MFIVCAGIVIQAFRAVAVFGASVGPVAGGVTEAGIAAHVREASLRLGTICSDETLDANTPFRMAFAIYSAVVICAAALWDDADISPTNATIGAFGRRQALGCFDRSVTIARAFITIARDFVAVARDFVAVTIPRAPAVPRAATTSADEKGKTEKAKALGE